MDPIHFMDIRRRTGTNRGTGATQYPVICELDFIEADEDYEGVTDFTDEATCPSCRSIIDAEAYHAIDPREERAAARGQI